MSDKHTPLPLFSSRSSSPAPSSHGDGDPPATSSSSTLANLPPSSVPLRTSSLIPVQEQGSSSFLQVPRPSYLRTKAPSVRLGSRGQDNSDSNSIFRGETSNSFGFTGRRRAATVDSPNPVRGGSILNERPGHGNSSRAGDLEDGLSQRPIRPGGGRRRALSTISWLSRASDGEDAEMARAEAAGDTEALRAAEERRRHDQQVIDLLDVIDPEVGTLTTLSDVQNSLFVPDLGRFVDRARYVRLTRPPPAAAPTPEPTLPSRPPSAVGAVSAPPSEAGIPEEAEEEEEEGDRIEARGKYLVLPDGLVDWEKWTDADKEELDDYVRHLLHSKKWKFKRTMRGFGHYVRTPLGAFVTIYASLLTFWGAAWILFIIGWLHAGDRQDYFVEICDEILTALFCFVGIGLAPFRAVDTYHMIYIAHFHRKSLRLYREQGAPPLADENDLPSPTGGVQEKKRSPKNVEEGLARLPVLSVQEQAKFIYHQTKFSKSHTFYRPHETVTHRAFPLDLLIVVVCLLDFHSIFQISLGSTTWSISYHHSFKKILTSIILSFSICCNISAGLVIVVGNRRTRKEEVLREQLHKAVTAEAVRRKLAKAEREKEEEEERRRKEEHHQDNAHSPLLQPILSNVPT